MSAKKMDRAEFAEKVRDALLIEDPQERYRAFREFMGGGPTAKVAVDALKLPTVCAGCGAAMQWYVDEAVCLDCEAREVFGPDTAPVYDRSGP